MMRVDNLPKAFVSAYFKCLDEGVIPTQREISKAIELGFNQNARRKDSAHGGYSLSKPDFNELLRELDRLCDEKGCERFQVLTDDDEQASSWHKSIYATYCKLKEERSLAGLTYENFHSEINKLHTGTSKIELARVILEKDFSLLENLRPQFSIFLKNLKYLAHDFLYELEAERRGINFSNNFVCSTYPLDEVDHGEVTSVQHDTPHQLFVYKFGETSFRSTTDDYQIAANALHGAYSYPPIAYSTLSDLNFASDAERKPYQGQPISTSGQAVAASGVHSKIASQLDDSKPTYSDNDLLFAKMSLGEVIGDPHSVRGIRRAEDYTNAVKKSLSNETEVSNTLMGLLRLTNDDLKICWCYWKETKYGPRHYADFGNFKPKVEEVVGRKVSGKELLDSLDKLEDIVKSTDTTPNANGKVFVTNIENLITTEFVNLSSYPHRTFDEFKNALLQNLGKYELGDQLQTRLTALNVGEAEMIVLQTCHHLKMFDARRKGLTQIITKDHLVSELKRRGHTFDDLDEIISRINNLIQRLEINHSPISFGLTPAQQILVPPLKRRAFAEAV